MPPVPVDGLVGVSWQNCPDDGLSVNSCYWIKYFIQNWLAELPYYVLGTAWLFWKMNSRGGSCSFRNKSLYIASYLLRNLKLVFDASLAAVVTELFLPLAGSFCSLFSVPFLSCQHNVFVAYVTNQMLDLICISCNPARMYAWKNLQH